MPVNQAKPRVVKDYAKLEPNVQEQIKLEYPDGFEDNLISFTNKEGNKVSALPFEAEDKYYLVRMTISEAQQIIEEDEDYDDDGQLREDIKEEYEEKHLEDNEDDADDLDPYADEEDDDDV